MDQRNGLEIKVSKEEIRITIMMDLQESFPHLIKISLQSPTSHMRSTANNMINAQISHSIEMMEIDLEMDLSTTRMGTGETMEVFVLLHRLKKEISHKITPIANHELINLTTLRFADLTTDLRLVLHLTNPSSHKATIRHHLMSFVSPPLTIPLLNNQIFAR